MQACIHSHIHACMCTCIHACMLAYIHTYMHTCIHTHIHTCLHACMHTYMHWFAIMVPHISAAYRECSYIFSTSRIGFHQFFSSVLCLINFHHCVIVFHFLCSSIFMSSSPVILLALSLRGLYSDICCHQCWSFVIVLFLGFIIFHICTYSCPSPSILFQRDPKNPSRRSSNLQNPYINFDTTNAILHKKLQWVQEIMYAMHAVCLISCLRLATEQHCILPQKGVNGKVYLIIHELKTHSGWSRRGTAQGGERVWWVGFLTISEYFIKYIYIYTYTKSYKNISSYIDITYIYRDHDQSLQHTRQTNTDTHPHKHTKKKKKTSGPISAPVRGLPANIWLL